MKQQPTLLRLLPLLLLFLASCAGKTKIPVPEDAAIVMHIDGASLSSKLSWEEISQSDWYKIAYGKTKDSLAKKVLADPAVSGIDTKSDFYVFMKTRGRGGYGALVGKVKDEKAFAAFMEQTMEGKKAAPEKGLSVIRAEKSVLTWKGDRFVMIFDNPEMNSGADLFGNERRPATDRSFPSDSLLLFASEVYDIKGKKSLGSNDRFNSIMKEKGDVHFWFNVSSMYGGGLPAMLALTKAGLLFEGNMTGATLNFDNGQIRIDSKSFYNKELAALYKKYQMKNMDASMLKMIPSKDVAAVIAMNYPPEGLKEFVKLLGVDGLINMMLSGEKFTLDDFIKANKGDLLFAVSDFGMKESASADGEEPGSAPRMKTSANFLFAASVNDKASFEKMISLLKEKIGKEGEAAATMAGKVPYQLKDNWFVAGNDSATVFSFGATSHEQPFAARLSGHPFGGFVDIRKFILGSRPGMDSTEWLVADASVKTWQDIVFYGGEFKNNATHMHAEINMGDKNTNSLKQLNSYVSVIARIMDEKEKKEKENRVPDAVIDTLIAAPPADAPKSN